MGKRLLPTTKVQVSGYRFMRRRVEHGIVFGDVRMIHDPLATRRRACTFGVVAVLLTTGVMGLFAWMQPNPDPGDAPILKAKDGSLYVRVDDIVHPVTNLTSARLVAGTDAEPERVGDEALAAMPRGVPVGIPLAPSLFAPGEDPKHAATSKPEAWSACHVGGDIVVRAGQAPAPLEEDRGVIAAVDGREWVITAHGRTLLPAPHTEEGRILRRALGISAATPRWSPPAALLNAIAERAPYAIPPGLEVLRTDAGWWVMTSEGDIQQVTQLQAQVLADAGATTSDVPRHLTAQLADAEPALNLRLPQQRLRWVDPEDEALCAGPDRGGATWAQDDARAGALRLSGTSVATHFAGLGAGAVGVDTGHGFVVVSTTGQRHAVPDEKSLNTIGAHRVEEVPWALLSLLPEGAELTRDAALTATY